MECGLEGREPRLHHLYETLQSTEYPRYSSRKQTNHEYTESGRTIRS